MSEFVRDILFYTFLTVGYVILMAVSLAGATWVVATVWQWTIVAC